MVIVLLSLIVFTVSSVSAWEAPPSTEITLSSTSIIQGEPLTLQGTASNSTELRFWLFGSDSLSTTENPVNPQSGFSYSLTADQTRNLTPGLYHLVVQYPGTGGIFDIHVANDFVFDEKNKPDQKVLFYLGALGEGRYPYSETYSSIIAALNDPLVNDSYENYVFSVTGAQQPANFPLTNSTITIDPVEDHSIGDTFVIQGLTGLPTGDQLMIEIISPNDMHPWPKLPEGVEISGVWDAITNVSAGRNQTNTWSYTVNTTGWKPQDYVIGVNAIKEIATTGSQFNLYRGKISINPVTGSLNDDSITINGTTTLPVNEVLDVSILHEPLAGIKCTSTRTFCGEYMGSANVIHGEGGFNLWTITVNTSTFWSGNYLIDVSSENGGVANATMEFTSPFLNTSPVPNAPTTTQSSPLSWGVSIAALAGVVIVNVYKRKKRGV